MGEWGGGPRAVRWKEGNTTEDPRTSTPEAPNALTVTGSYPSGKTRWGACLGLPWAEFHHQLFLLLASATSQSYRVYKCPSDLLRLSPGQKGAADKDCARPLRQATRWPGLAEAWLTDAPGLPHCPPAIRFFTKKVPGAPGKSAGSRRLITAKPRPHRMGSHRPGFRG